MYQLRRYATIALIGLLGLASAAALGTIASPPADRALAHPNSAIQR